MKCLLCVFFVIEGSKCKQKFEKSGPNIYWCGFKELPAAILTAAFEA